VTRNIYQLLSVLSYSHINILASFHVKGVPMADRLKRCTAVLPVVGSNLITSGFVECVSPGVVLVVYLLPSTELGVTNSSKIK